MLLHANSLINCTASACCATQATHPQGVAYTQPAYIAPSPPPSLHCPTSIAYLEQITHAAHKVHHLANTNAATADTTPQLSQLPKPSHYITPALAHAAPMALTGHATKTLTYNAACATVATRVAALHGGR